MILILRSPLIKLTDNFKLDYGDLRPFFFLMTIVNQLTMAQIRRKILTKSTSASLIYGKSCLT